MRLLCLILVIALPGMGRATETVPALHLLWSPEAHSLTFLYAGGCMSSSIPVAGDTLTTEVRDGTIHISGGFLLGPAPVIATMDFGNCPTVATTKHGIRPGTYALRYRGRPLRPVVLGNAPLEIAVPLTPWLTPEDLRIASRHGFNRIWNAPDRDMSPYYLEDAGPADVRPVPDSLLTHVTPDPLIYWEPTPGVIRVEFYFGCLSSNYLYMGSDRRVALNRRDRIITVSGDIRFLPLPSDARTRPCRGSPVGPVLFDDVPPGDYSVIQDGRVLFTAHFGPVHTNVNRFRARFLE